MDRLSVGNAGLQGWRARAADVVAPTVARHSPFSEDEVRAAVGALFLVLAIVYVLSALKRIAART